MDVAVPATHPPAADWGRLAAKARQRRRMSMGLLYIALALGSLPILVPYLWLFTVAFSGRTGASTVVLWRTLAVLMPGLVAWSIIRLAVEDAGRRRLLEIGLAVVVLVALGLTTAPYLQIGRAHV